MSSILELEKEGRYSEAGYGKLFAFESLHYNAVIDSRTKAKYIRELNPETYNETQNEILYSGPTVFYDKHIELKEKVIKLDIKSAYPSYWMNEQINKPGVKRIKVNGAVPLSQYITLYIIRFKTSVDSLFVKWFLNSSAIHQRRIQTDGKYTWGEIGIFSSIDMNLMQYVNAYLPNGAIIVKSYIFIGKEAVEVEKGQLRKLYWLKESGIDEAKTELNASTGWLSKIDKPTYYHMVQWIKYYLLKTMFDYQLQYNTFGVQTDCLFVTYDEFTNESIKLLKLDNPTLSNERSSMGTFKIQIVDTKDVITGKARIVVNAT